MILQRTLLLLALFGAWAVAQTCEVNETNGFLGKDLGIVEFVAYEYELVVITGTTADNVTAILPGLEKFLAEAVAPSLIDGCNTTSAAGAVSNEFVGFDIQPADKIVTSKECTSIKGDCFVIHNDWAIYVSSSGIAAADTLNLALTSLLMAGAADPTVDFPAIVEILVPFNVTTSNALSEAPSISPSSSPTAAADADGGLFGSDIFDFASHLDTINEFRVENAMIFYGIVLGGAVIFLCCCIFCCKVCCGSEGKFDDDDDDDNSIGRHKQQL